MRTFLKFQNLRLFKSKTLAIVSIVSLILIACGGGGHNKVRLEQLNEHKSNTLVTLNSIIDDIDQRIAFIDDEIDKAGGVTKERLEDARIELMDQKILIEEEKENIENATMENWNDVIESTSETTEGVIARTNEISSEVRETLEM
jgi:hypothetical protein